MNIEAPETGRYIRQYRKIAGLTQEELAQKVGISTMSIRRYETGERIASREILHAIASALDIDFLSLAPWDQAAKELEDDINAGIDAQGRLDAAFKRLTGAGRKLVADTAEAIAGNPKYQLRPLPPGTDTTPAEPRPESTENG